MFRAFIFVCLCFTALAVFRLYGNQDRGTDNLSAKSSVAAQTRGTKSKQASSQEVSEKETDDNYQPPAQISAPALQADYEQNEIAADQTYKGKIIEVRGAVARIRKDFADRPILEWQTLSRYKTVSAYLSDSSVSFAATLSPGDTVTVLCKGDGSVLESPILKDCSIK